MRLRIERLGGFAGVPAVGERDLDQLSQKQREALEKLLCAPRAAPSPGADRFRYKVRVTGDGAPREIEVGEDEMPEALASIAEVKL